MNNLILAALLSEWSTALDDERQRILDLLPTTTEPVGVPVVAGAFIAALSGKQYTEVPKTYDVTRPTDDLAALSELVAKMDDLVSRLRGEIKEVKHDN
jgi:hypothetical protein